MIRFVPSPWSGKILILSSLWTLWSVEQPLTKKTLQKNIVKSTINLSEILKKCSNNPKESSKGEKNGMKNRTNKK